MANRPFLDLTPVPTDRSPLSAPSSPVSPHINAVNSPIIGNAKDNIFNYNAENIVCTVYNVYISDKIVAQAEHTKGNTSPKYGAWKKETEIRTFGQNGDKFQLADEIAAFSTNEIVIFDRKHDKLIAFLPLSEHPGYLSQVLPTALDNPSHISVNTDDQLIVLDPPSVKIFNRAYEPCLHQFKPGKDVYSKPSCLSVDDNNVIAVGYDRVEKISLHDPNGHCRRIIPAPMIGEHMTTYKNRLIYINRDRKKLLSTDSNEGSVFCEDIFETFPESKAYGLCCDSAGDIYVAVHAGRLSEGEIQRYSPDGKYIGCAQRVDGFPRDITFTPSGDLVMAAEKKVKIYTPGISRQFAFYKRRNKAHKKKDNVIANVFK